MIKRNSLKLGILSSVLCLFGGAVSAEMKPLPDPLSLEDAITYANPNAPKLALASAQQALLAAERSGVASGFDPELSLTATAKWIDPADLASNRNSNDSQAVLSLKQKVYDFGLSNALDESAGLKQQSGDWDYVVAAQEQHLTIMRAFFDVLLADLEFARDNEAMSIAFIRADRARDHNEVNRVNDVDLLEAEANYQKVRLLRFASESRQRATRSRLAMAMGRPNDLVSDVSKPKDIDVSQPIRDYDLILEEVLTNSPHLQSARSQVSAARQALRAVDAQYGPSLNAELNAATYNRDSSSRHPFTAGLTFELPLLSSGAEEAAKAKGQANLSKAEAKLQAIELDLRQQSLDLWLQQGVLRVKLDQANAESDYRDLALDRSRALYELDLKADIGNAMTEITSAILNQSTTMFNLMMTRAKLAALSGSLLQKEEK